MKTKVIAFRVTQDEYDALAVVGQKLGDRPVSSVVYNAIQEHIKAGKELAEQQRKAAERKAKREAKKAAANGAQ